MNESIEKDSQELAINRQRYLEDQGGQFQNYEYDEDAYADNKDQNFSGQKESAIRDSIGKKKRKDAPEPEGGNDTQEDIRLPTTQGVEIGLIFFCLYETNPQTFIRFVLWAKILDILVYLIVFGTYMIWGQVVLSLAAAFICIKQYRGLVSRRLYSALFWLMVLHQLFTSVVFVVKLVDSTKGLESGYVIFLAFAYLFWLTQGMAWDFQLMDNFDAFFEVGLAVEESKGPQPSLEDSIGRESLPEEKQTKNKLKKRTSSSVNTDPGDDL
jgi:hypothetical protein